MSFEPGKSSSTTDGHGWTRMGTGFVMVGNLFRGYLPGEHPWHRNPFFIRVIRENLKAETGGRKAMK